MSGGIPTPDFPTPAARPRRSTFAQAAAAEKGDQPPQQPRAAQPAVPPAPVPAPARPNRKAATTDILLSLDEDLKQRMVNTIAGSAMHTGIKQQQMFIRHAIKQLCERIEADYNRGEQYPTPPPPPTI